MEGIGVYVSYSELTGEPVTDDDLIAVLSRLPRIPTFLFLCKVSMGLSLYELPDRLEQLQQARGTLFVTLLDDTLRRAYETKPLHRPEDILRERLQNRRYDHFDRRPAFHKQQLLYAMKRVLRDSPDRETFRYELSKEDMHELGKACLMVNDLLVTEAQNSRSPSSPTQTAEELSTRSREFLAQLLPVFELQKTRLFTTSLAESWVFIQLFRHEPPASFSEQGRTLDDLFRQHTGLDLETYFMLVTFNVANYIGLDFDDLLANQEKFNIDETRLFRKLDFPAAEIERVYEYLRCTPQHYRDVFASQQATTPFLDQFDFLPFHEHPIVSINPPISIPIDANLLAHKMSSGLYHALFNALPSDDRNAFFSAWGEVFEKYVNLVFEQVYDGRGKTFHREQPFIGVKTDQSSFDGFIDGGRSVIAMEYKGGYLNSTKYKDDPAALWTAIDTKYGTTKSGAGIEQLVRKLTLLYSADKTSRRSFGSYDQRRARVVYPVLIVQETALEIGFAQMLLKETFETAMDRRKIDPCVSIRPLSVLSIDDLQHVLPSVSAGDFALPRVLDDYASRLAEHPTLTFQRALSLFQNSRGFKSRDNDWTRADFHSVMEVLKSHFMDRSDN